MAENLPPDGELHTIDIEPKKYTDQFWDKSPHGQKITAHKGEALYLMTKLEGLFDLVFLDADKTNYLDYAKLALPHLSGRGIIVVDNVLWSGAVLRPDEEIDPNEFSTRGIKRFNDWVASRDDLYKTLLPIRDGIFFDLPEKMRQGYILTAHSEDRPEGHTIRFFGRGPEGPFELVIGDQKPLFFVERTAEIGFLSHAFERRPVKLKNFQNQDVDALYFHRRKDLFEAREELKKRGIRTFESDVTPHQRFLMERFIKGSVEFTGEAKEREGGVQVFVNPQMRAGDYRPRLSTASIDIETSREDALFSIAIDFQGEEEGREGRVYMVGEDQGPLNRERGVDGKLFYFPDEKSCYQAFARDFHRLDPDIVIGWHVVGFDLAFLEKKCRRWGLELALGRKQSRAFIDERPNGQFVARLWGRVVIDGPPALRGAFYQFEDFKLDTVAREVLGTSKDIAGTGLSKMDEIERRFREDKPSLALYNLLDCRLVTQIYEKIGLVELTVMRTLISGLLLDKVGFSTAAFDFIMLPEIHRRGFVRPQYRRCDPQCGGQWGVCPRTQSGHSPVCRPPRLQKFVPLDYQNIQD